MNRGMAKLMSAPNKQYDPVEVTALSPEQIAAALKEALAAIAEARTLDELKAARLAHAGDRSPLALANAEIGALPPQARARPASGSAPLAVRSGRRSTPGRRNSKPSATSGCSSRRPSM